jgi:hypothetical protein
MFGNLNRRNNGDGGDERRLHSAVERSVGRLAGPWQSLTGRADRLPDCRACPNWLTAVSSGLEFRELAADVAEELCCPLGRYC